MASSKIYGTDPGYSIDPDGYSSVDVHFGYQQLDCVPIPPDTVCNYGKRSRLLRETGCGPRSSGLRNQRMLAEFPRCQRVLVGDGSYVLHRFSFVRRLYEQ
jgi:hypothetical protein